MGILTISELASYILTTCADKQITHMKLQQLAYYVKAWTLVAGYPIILNAEFEKWQFGPVNQTLYNEYKAYGNRVITEKVSPPLMAPNDQKIIDFILENYCDYSAFDLSAMTHNEKPWQQTGNNRVISDNAIKKHYSNEPFANNFADFDPENGPFYMLRDPAWYAFTMDMSPHDKELATFVDSYREYKRLKRQSKAFISFLQTT